MFLCCFFLLSALFFHPSSSLCHWSDKTRDVAAAQQLADCFDSHGSMSLCCHIGLQCFQLPLHRTWVRATESQHCFHIWTYKGVNALKLLWHCNWSFWYKVYSLNKPRLQCRIFVNKTIVYCKGKCGFKKKKDLSSGCASRHLYPLPIIYICNLSQFHTSVYSSGTYSTWSILYSMSHWWTLTKQIILWLRLGLSDQVWSVCLSYLIP